MSYRRQSNNNNHRRDSSSDRNYGNRNNDKRKTNRSQNNSRRNYTTAEPNKNEKMETDMFIGKNRFLRTKNDVADCRDLSLMKPNSMFMHDSQDANYPCQKVKDYMVVRSIIFDPDVSFYPDLFNTDGSIKHAGHYNQAFTKIQTDFNKVIAFHKPARVFVQIFDPSDEHQSHFGASLQWVCYNNGWVPIHMNPVGNRRGIDDDDLTSEEQHKIWRARIKFHLKEYHPRNQPVQSPGKGIDCNEYQRR